MGFGRRSEIMVQLRLPEGVVHQFEFAADFL